VLLEFALENAVHRTKQGEKPPKTQSSVAERSTCCTKWADFKTGFMLACATKALYGYGHILTGSPSPVALAVLGVADAARTKQSDSSESECSP